MNLWAIKESAKDLMYYAIVPIAKFLKIKIPFIRRKVKTLFVHKNGKSSRLKYSRFIHGSFQTKDGETVKNVIIDLNSKAWRMDYSHELAHLLTLHTLDSDEYIYNIWTALRAEVTAWRLAKSFVKKKYWNEKYAVACLTELFPNIVNADKLRKVGIIPLNEGLRIPHLCLD